MRHDAQRRRIARRERIDPRIILADRGLQQVERLEAVRRAVETGEPREVVHEPLRGATVYAELGAVQQGGAGGTAVQRRRHGRIPCHCVLTLDERRLDQRQPRFGFRIFLPNVRQALRRLCG